MIQAKCIQKFRDKTGKIYGYGLIDTNGKTANFYADALKENIRNKQIEVTNLTLTSDNRLVDKEDTSLEDAKKKQEEALARKQAEKARKQAEKARKQAEREQKEEYAKIKQERFEEAVKNNSPRLCIFLNKDKYRDNSVMYILFFPYKGITEVYDSKGVASNAYDIGKYGFIPLNFKVSGRGIIGNIDTGIDKYIDKNKAVSLITRKIIERIDSEKDLTIIPNITDKVEKKLTLLGYNKKSIGNELYTFESPTSIYLVSKYSIILDDTEAYSSLGITSYEGIFRKTNFKSIDLSRVSLRNKPFMSGMFMGCKATSITMPRYKTARKSCPSRLFDGCNFLKEVDIAGFDFDKVDENMIGWDYPSFKILTSDKRIVEMYPDRAKLADNVKYYETEKLEYPDITKDDVAVRVMEDMKNRTLAEFSKELDIEIKDLYHEYVGCGKSLYTCYYENPFGISSFINALRKLCIDRKYVSFDEFEDWILNCIDCYAHYKEYKTLEEYIKQK